MKYIISILLLIVIITPSQAQIISFKDTIAAYNLQRIRINISGERVIGVWGIANMAAGSIGLANAKQEQWKYFHGMNIAFGAGNTLLSAAGLLSAHRQLRKFPGADKSYKLYRNNKRAYLISSLTDVVLVAGGATLVRLGQTNKNDRSDMFTGFGKSITLQGIALLLFDNVMYASQVSNNSKWFQIMNEIHLSGNGIGFNYNF